MNMMPTSYSDLVKERKERAQAVHKEIEGDHLNLGKKISVPRDVMMEELALLSNKGSRMFHERQKRVDRFTLENMKEGPLTVQNGTQPLSDSGKENFRTEIYIGQPGKGDFLSTLKKKAAKKSGNPNSIAPGYSGPLKEIPHEKFNITVIPKSYQSPWRESLTDTEELLHSLNQQLPEPPPKPQFRCFNRAPLPFGGTAGYERTFPLPGFELSHAQTEPSLSLARILNRPNFNRAPRGWGSAILQSLLSCKPRDYDLQIRAIAQKSTASLSYSLQPS